MYIATTVIAIEFLVMTVCLYMSVNNCSMLKETHSIMGQERYFWGNGAVHYLPIVAVVAFQLEWDRTTYNNQVYLAYAIVMAYIGTDNFHTYGCNVEKWHLYVASTLFHFLLLGLGRFLNWSEPWDFSKIVS